MSKETGGRGQTSSQAPVGPLNTQAEEDKTFLSPLKGTHLSKLLRNTELPVYPL